jgi:hypothetical protein
MMSRSANAIATIIYPSSRNGQSVTTLKYILPCLCLPSFSMRKYRDVAVTCPNTAT